MLLYSKEKPQDPRFAKHLPLFFSISSKRHKIQVYFLVLRPSFILLRNLFNQNFLALPLVSLPRPIQVKTDLCLAAHSATWPVIVANQVNDHRHLRRTNDSRHHINGFRWPSSSLELIHSWIRGLPAVTNTKCLCEAIALIRERASRRKGAPAKNSLDWVFLETKTLDALNLGSAVCLKSYKLALSCNSSEDSVKETRTTKSQTKQLSILPTCFNFPWVQQNSFSLCWFN